MKHLEPVIRKAFEDIKARPTSLDKALAASALYLDGPEVSQADLSVFLQVSIDEVPAENSALIAIRRALSHLDARPPCEWTEGTAHQSSQRRELIYEVLQITAELKDQMSSRFPVHLSSSDRGFIVSGDFEHWFNAEDQEKEGFYWPKYVELLRDVEKWPTDTGNLEDLDRATELITERIADPMRADIFAARGLVVGYVQSGKTANFTGVIARAIDAGYRLVIVLTGTTELLRKQTQRRLDKQLIGKEQLKHYASGDFEYDGVKDWDSFISYGGLPSHQGEEAPDLLRLTSLKSDYRRLNRGIRALYFDKAVQSEPLNSPSNLAATPVRLLVMKKNKAALRALIHDLRKVRDAGFELDSLPALVIDDESDQASVNTKKPSASSIQENTIINQAIIDLLRELPRGQYVGYTATPFANVFVDPNDDLNIYPRHFIIGLDAPSGYMGASAYHDFAAVSSDEVGNEEAYVRDVSGIGTEELRDAIDSYVLTGAIKLFRSSAGANVSVRHHTMLVHTSQKTSDHEAMKKQIEQIVASSGYWDGRAEARLERLLENDFRPVSQARAESLPFPASYDELRESVSQCLSRLDAGGPPVLIVNGVKAFAEETPDFDDSAIWKILVGGTKLSRGYTVEGLTVSYYRRSTRAADTLMQMGRWFGFRPGYSDLMRLYIGRSEPPNSKKPLDLYRAFEAICHDEIDFRAELAQYAMPADGSDPIQPLHVPPLVSQRMPDVIPTAKNKMFNAQLVSENFGGKAIARTLAPLDPKDIERNLRASSHLMSKSQFEGVVLGEGTGFKAFAGYAEPQEMINFVRQYRFSKKGLLDRFTAFLDGAIGDPGIDRWVIVWPRTDKSAKGPYTPAPGLTVGISTRERDPNTGRFNVYTGSDHVTAAKMIAGTESSSDATSDTARFLSPRTGAVLFYAVQEKNSSEIHIGFSLYPPKNKIQKKTQWGLRDPSRADEPIVDV